ncbi:MAG: hopanoid biosynthesis-associated protein HpnK [Alphaproteobacteria bacterium]
MNGAPIAAPSPVPRPDPPSAAARRLVVTGDDFGLAPEVNRGIVRAHREGILRCTSLMVAAPAAAEAVEMARATPTLDVGLHLVLVRGRATAPPRTIHGLARTDGRLREGAVAAGLAWFFRRDLQRALAVEIRAQLEAFRATGLALSHVDGHLNVHLHPVALDVLAELAEEFRIPALRLAHDPVLPALRRDPTSATRKLFEGVAFRALSNRARERLRGHGVMLADRLHGLHRSGRCDERWMLQAIDDLAPGTTEIYVHPAEEHTPFLERLMPGYRHREELAALVSPRVRLAVERAGIEVTSWRELAASAVVPEVPERERGGSAAAVGTPGTGRVVRGFDGGRDPS